MKGWIVYSKDGLTERCEVRKLEYSGEFMSACSVNVTISSPTPIDFELGDWLEYRDERFEINYDPTVVKQSACNTYGEGFVYENVIFNSLSDELTRCDFLDYVKKDSDLHYSSLPTFSFFADSIQKLADRIQANLDRVYENERKWTVIVHDEYVNTLNVNIQVSNNTVWDALGFVNSKFGANFIIRNRTIIIGTTGLAVGQLFSYGKGNGLYKIERSAESNQKIITRLRAYGSTRNMPMDYYNNIKDGNVPNNMAVKNLMLPSFPIETHDPYIDSKNIEELGIREGTVFFDGSGDLEEIYPTIEGMTAEDLLEAGVRVESTGILNEVANASKIEDDGKFEEGADKPDFTIIIKDIGFDLNNAKGASAATISMKNGMCGGREFEIQKCERSGSYYILTCKRQYDTGLDLYFPYNDYQVQMGDRFVILNIEMPDVYIKAASQRLLKAAKAYLAKNDYVRYSYIPTIDNIFMARQHDEAVANGYASIHDTIKEGDLLLFEDEDLGIKDGSVTIASLSIKENIDESLIPEYEITLQDEKTVGTLERIQNQIDSMSRGGSAVVNLNEEQIKSIVYAAGSKMFLRKDKDDRSKGKISSDKGFEVGRFVKDMVGGGAKFYYDETTKKTIIEADKAFFREEMLVPKITFNCIDAISGDKAQTFAYGTIKQVFPSGSGGEATLDLLSDQYGNIQVDDILRGIFHRLEGNPSVDLQSDINGFHSYSGFSTAYFTPTAILESRAGVMRFRYQLQEGTTVHPCAGMNFYAYGNFDGSKTDRHSVTYETRQYTRRLCGMTQWTIDPDKHIKYQDGLLDGLTIGKMEMKGYGTYADNLYITGSFIEFTPQQKEELKGQDSYMVSLTEYVGSVRMNAKGEIEDGIFRPVNVSMDGENVGTDDDNLVAKEYLLQTRIQVFKGEEELVYTDELKEGTYIASISPVGCKAELDNGVVSVTEIIDTEFCYVTIYVNCEGNASRELSYQVKVLKDGQITFKSMVFTRSDEKPATPSPTGSFDSPFPTDEVEIEEGNKIRVWTDGIPVGEAKVWMSTRIFSSDGKVPQQESWSEPQDMTDTADFEVVYSEQEEQPEAPERYPSFDGWLPPAPWTDNANVNSIWMATAVRHNGTWSEWQIAKIKGESGDASFKSFVFTRSEKRPSTPQGGDYSSPYPTDEVDGNLVWEDGVPEGESQLWVSTRIFSSKGKHPQQDSWTMPTALTDTTDFEVIYSPLKEYLPIPIEFKKVGVELDDEWEATANAMGWYDDVEDFQGDAIWMATNTSNNGRWKGWQISRIKGEDGKEALSISVSATAVSRNSLGSYEPSNVLVNARRGSSETEVGLTIFGETETGYNAISPEGFYEEYDSFWNIKLSALSSADYKSIVFRAYDGVRSTSYEDSYDAEATVVFIGSGASGAMPRNRGKFEEGVAYCYNDEYRDFVWTTNGMVYMRTSKYATSEGQEHGYVVADVTNTNYWAIADRSTLMAIDTALIDNAHIAGFTFRLKDTLDDGTPIGILESQNKLLSLDAETGALYCQNATVEGSITAGEMAYSVLSASDDESWFNLKDYGMASGRGNYILPSINSGKSMQIRAICLNISGDKSIPFNFKSDSGTTFIYVKSDWDDKFYPKTEVALDYNRLYTFTSDGNSWILSEGMSAKSDGQSALTIDTQISDSSPNPVQNMAIAEEFKKHVKLGNADDPVQTITRPTNFTGGFSVNNKSLKYVENNGKGYWVMDGDVLVTGGVTVHASETAYKPSTIMDAVRVDSTSISKDNGKLEVVGIDPAIALAAINVDGKTISKAKGYLEVIGGAGGGGESGGGGEITPSTVMEALTVDDVTISKANGTLSVKDVPWSKISGKQTTLSGYGITDAKIADGIITLGTSTITPLTQSLGDARYITSIGVGESTLNWVKDGNAHEITIPYATKAGSLNIANKTAWGQTFFNNGVPSNVSGDMSGVGDIELDYHSGSNNLYINGSSSQYGSSRWKIGTTGQYLQFDIEEGTTSSGDSIGTVQVLQLDATKTWVKTDLQVWGDVYPYTSASYTLGTTDKRWKAVHADKIQFYNEDYSITNPTNGININTYSLFSLIQTTSGATRLHMNQLGRIGVNTKDPIATLHVNGDLFVSGGITFRSDIRKKVKLEDVELSLDDVADAPLIKHYYTDDEEKTVHVSSVAQYWNERNDWFTKEDKDGFLTMEIANAALASAISTAREFRRYKEQSEERIVSLEKRIGELERMFNELKDR